jgi:2-aminoadipate transaminase
MVSNRARRMINIKPNAIGELLKQGADPGLISFAGGYPDSASFPLEQLDTVFHEVIHNRGASALQYTVSDGPLAFREQLAVRMRARGLNCSAEQVLVLNGSQQGLDLAARMFVDPNDVIVTESPTFLGAMIAFQPCEPQFVGVQMDQQGMNVDHLDHVLKSTPNVRMIYTIPDFQNPTGVTLSADRRQRLVELANQYDVIVLEDTAYRDLRFAGEAPPTIKSFDTQGRVVMLGSFSKILAPGLRLGWVVASHPIIQDLGLLKLAADTQSSTVNMAATSLFLDHYDIDAHIVKLRDVYRRKKNLMLDSFRRHFPQSVTFTDPDGGLFTWVTFPAGFDAARFLAVHALPEAKVAFVPGATFFPSVQETNHARFNYSGQSDDRIAEGIERLGKLLRRELAS